MNILLLRTYPSVMDPAAYNSQEVGLARAFVRAGHRCGILYYCARQPAHDQAVPVPGSSETVTIHWRPGYNLLKNGIFPHLSELISRYDVLQVAEYDQLTSWRLYRHPPAGKLVTLYHGPYQSEFTKGYNLKCRVFDLLCNRKRKNAAVPCFAKSGLAADFLCQKGFETVYPVGVGLDKDTLAAPYDATARVAAAIRPGFELLYIGVLEERRNIRFLFEVLAETAKRLPEVRLVLVGRGEESYRDACFAYARELGVWDRIDYREKVPQAEVHALYDHANLLLLPTQYEIFGMVLLEAMYFGLPALTSLNGGSSVLIRDGVNGLVQQGFSAAEYAGRIQALAADPEAQARIGAAAHAAIERDFLWDSIAEKMLAVYQAQRQGEG